MIVLAFSAICMMTIVCFVGTRTGEDHQTLYYGASKERIYRCVYLHVYARVCTYVCSVHVICVCLLQICSIVHSITNEPSH